jgi:tetratricopeptide (TPR) repeat protein
VMYLKGREEYRKQTTESMKAAREFFEQAITLDPEYASAYVALADTIAMLSDGPSFFGVLKSDISATLAEKNLEKAIVRAPDIAEIYAVMGVVRALRGKFDESLAAFDKSLVLNPSLAIAYMWKSNSLLQLQRLEEAIEAQQKARELDPLFVTNSHNLATLLVWQGKYDLAKNIFLQLKEDHPNSVFPYQGLAGLYFDQGNFVASIENVQKAIAISPDNDELQFRLYSSILNLGLTDILKQQTTDPIYQSTILSLEKKFDELFDLMEFSLAANPDDYWTAFEAGWYQAMFGNKQQALSLLTNNYEILDDVDKYAMPYCSPAIEIAWAQQHLADTQKAKAHLDKCFQMFKNKIDSGEKDPILFYLGARLYALKREPALSLEYLQKAADNGWREWWTKHDPLLSSINENPKYKDIIAFIDADLARQAKEARELFQ